MDRIALLKENQGLAHCLMSGVFIIRCLAMMVNLCHVSYVSRVQTRRGPGWVQSKKHCCISSVASVKLVYKYQTCLLCPLVSQNVLFISTMRRCL